jgi:hypothetical protein
MNRNTCRVGKGYFAVIAFLLIGMFLLSVPVGTWIHEYEATQHDFPMRILEVPEAVSRIYEHKAREGTWPAKLSDVCKDVDVPDDWKYRGPVGEEVDGIAFLTLRGPYHMSLVYTFDTTQEAPQGDWVFCEEGSPRAIPIHALKEFEEQLNCAKLGS